MSAPKLGVGGAERAPLAVVIVIGSVIGAGLWGRVPWWIAPAAATVLAVSLTLRVNGRSGPRWLADWWSFRAGMAARAAAVQRRIPAREVSVPSGDCGVYETDSALIAMIQLAPNLDLPTVIAERELYTEDTVPVEALLPMLDQYGLVIDVDIVTTGQRVRPAGGYSMLYDQLIGTHPVVGDRMTWLVVRLDLQRNLVALSKRGPVADSGPRALASAANRIAARLRERGISAHPLPASALVEATRLLHGGVELTDLREKWGRLETSVPNRSVTSFLIDWSRMEGAGLDDCWSWNKGRTTVVVSLAGGALGARGLVRYVGPPVAGSPPGYLRPLGGRQAEALLASLPTETSVHDLPRPRSAGDLASAEQVSQLSIPIGPSGQILGAISGRPTHTLAMPLFDPARYNPRHRTIDVYAELPVAQQIVLRAMVVGADVEVYSARPQQWQQLVASVGDPDSLRLAPEPPGGRSTAAGSSATIAVFDQVPPAGSAAPTTVTINDPGAPRRRSADLAIDQVSSTAIDVSIPMRTVRVDLIEPRGETRYVNSAGDFPASGPPAISAPETLSAPPGQIPGVIRGGSNEVNR
ncbi:type VII secretion protein EccE [Nocardia veterana]|uniref:Type VII secretion protein EccE n=1 Tax=Nocardia veterana TaxID=132249 RepID=A0A7X6LZ41_9NOCA|nr:type VII secretion protein EccE [Nocardia veterana]NKY87253.1 type VII secretion protein EccE [Nocardia veterana]